MSHELTDRAIYGSYSENKPWTFDRMDHKVDLGIKITKVDSGLQVYVLKESRQGREEIIFSLPMNAVKSLTAWLNAQVEG